jgi:hypothetical protein
MSEIPASNLPQKFTSGDEQHGVDDNELVDTTIDEAQVSSLILLSLFLHLISRLNLI